MLSYRYKTKLPLNKKKLLYDIILDISKYKYFIPWCVDSYVSDSKSEDINNISSIDRILYNSSTLINKDNNTIKYDFNFNNEKETLFLNYNEDKVIDGILSVGVGLINFSYKSRVFYNTNSNIISKTNFKNKNNNEISELIEDYFIFSSIRKSKVFKSLNSLFLFKDSYNDFELSYYLNFDFKSSLYHNLTSVMLDSLGKTMVNAFLNELDNQYKCMLKNNIDNKTLSLIQRLISLNLMNNNDLNYIIENYNYNAELKHKLEFYAKNAILDNNYFLNIMAKDIKKDIYI